MDSRRTTPALVLPCLVLVACLLTGQQCSSKANGGQDGPLSETSVYPYQDTLDNNYSLKWNHNTSHILLHIKVKTLGWVGFGISAHGDMYPGDMVTAWMTGTTVHFQDRHATGRVMPVVDKRQDWHLVRFQREDNLYTTLTVLRRLDTCDQDGDLPILRGTTRVIYAYSDAVPDTDDGSIPPHDSHTRGSKSILLLDPPASPGFNGHMPNDVTTIDLLNKNYAVPSKYTTYACVLMKIQPPTPGKHHLIRYEPVIQTGHEKLVHHVVLMSCSKPIPGPLLNKPYDCFQDSPKETVGVCDTTVLAWGIGGYGISYPPHVGHSIGTPEDPVYFKLETHYNNVDMRSDYVDSSGLRWYVTRQLRKYDGGTLPVATFSDKNHIVPPRMNSFLSRAYCLPPCLEKALGDSEIRIFGVILHSHNIGRKMATRHVRDGVELPPIAKDDHYDFNYQETRMLEEERVVKKYDTLMADCYYDSSKRTNVTYGGFSALDEMCVSFLFYYPRKALNICFTRAIYSKESQPMYPGGGLQEFVDNTDWSVESTREQFDKNTQTSDVVNICIYNDSTMEIRSPQPPEKFKQFVDVVTKNTPSCLGGVGKVLENPVGGGAATTTMMMTTMTVRGFPNPEAVLVYIACPLVSILMMRYQL